ncbi:hypothetical protein Msil_3382 [Methylocella silvestris BL2]|uniref:Uncharacterized protein n=1 Tax=Methylocella silvestris (strain DSM 15510 / CIP 108128 / LMG 27833 / NCIMB 13906 / BL2) TaxID=395965 RepID=B8ES70_METSB|nr:hypothetical protein [Methylocella silvestris]ACK52285.1 hypothetical protein Msil_3382 [Methylocella silvestris BL2]
MAQNQTATSPIEHPAPARGEIGVAALAFGLIGAPASWAAHFLMNVTIASRACFPGSQPSSLASAAALAHALILTIDGLATLTACAALAISYLAWRSTAHEKAAKQRHGSRPEHAAEVGEGRTRFIALGGILMSSVFIVAILFDTLPAIVTPACGQ